MKYEVGQRVRVVQGQREKSHDYAGMCGTVIEVFAEEGDEWPYSVEFYIGEPSADETGLDVEIFAESELEPENAFGPQAA